MPYERELEAALEAARRAGEAIRKHYATFKQIADPPANISTLADKESQEAILGHLRAAFPDDAFCAEEDTPALAGARRAGPRVWVIDPIDGTRGFAVKNDEFSVMIGLAAEGQSVFGVVYQPARERLTYAMRGGGCWRRDGGEAPVRCQVSGVRQLSEATLTESWDRDSGRLDRWVRLLGPARVIQTYSAGIKLALVARGEADLYVNTYLKFHDWDICAGHVLVDEAGGCVTGFGGQELRYGEPGAWQRHGLLASNGFLHEAVLAATARGLPG